MNKTEPKPLREMDLKPGDVVRCVKGDESGQYYTPGEEYEIGGLDNFGAGVRPQEHASFGLFTLVRRAEHPTTPDSNLSDMHHELQESAMSNPIVVHEGKIYDLRELREAWGLLPEPVRDRMKEWPHGWERFGGVYWEDDIGDVRCFTLTYRAKHAPKIREHILWWEAASGCTLYRRSQVVDTHKITLRYTGDTLPAGTYTGPDGAEIVVEELPHD